VRDYVAHRAESARALRVEVEHSTPINGIRQRLLARRQQVTTNCAIPDGAIRAITMPLNAETSHAAVALASIQRR
jgi:hypothetical protein